MPSLAGRRWFADSLLLFALTACLIWPLFQMDYMENWGSIESTFIGDGRMLRDRGLQAEWQPNWYLGTRFDYVYPPMLRFGTAALSKWLGVSTARSYHLYTATVYCLGIVGIYWLMRIGSGSRGWAWIAALSVAIHSPALLFLEHFRQDAIPVRFMPVRLGVLIRYGEGPHISALALLGFALAASWIGVRRGQVAALVLAGIFSALVVSNNFYGATALALFFPILVWAIAVTERDAWVVARAAGVAAIAYGLTASWFTPSYLRVTLENMRLVSSPGNLWSVCLEAAVLAAFAAGSWWLARGRPERAWTAFTIGAFARIALYVLGHYYFGFRTIGEPERLGPEFDQFFIIAAVGLLAWMWPRGLARKLAVIGLIWLSLMPVKGWVRRSWQYFEPAKGYEHRVEYELTKWLHDNMPQSRVFVAGSVRFWFNAWFDLVEVSGGSDQGTLNPHASMAYYQVAGGESAPLTLAWLLATGTDAVVVNYPESREYYHDFGQNTKKFAALPVLYDNGKGDKIHKVPRKYPGLARIVRAADHAKLVSPKIDYDYTALQPYVALAEEFSPRAADWQRITPEQMRVRAKLEEGEALVILETFDAGWHATTAEGRPVPLRRDALHFMRLDPGPGTHDITLRYLTPLENRVGRAISAVTVGICVFLLTRSWGRRRRGTV